MSLGRGTATSNRASDVELERLNRGVGGPLGSEYELGKHFRKMHIPVKLTDLRELSSGDIPTGRVETVTIGVPLSTCREVTAVGETADVFADDDFGGTADVAFGLLGGATTPILQANNGAGGADELHWAASDSDAIQFSVSLPNIDVASDVTVTLRASVASTTDTPVFDIDSYFNESDGKISDASGTADNTAENLAVTIAAADVPAGARTLGVEITPAAHTTDALYLHEIRVSYTSTGAVGAGGVLDKGTTPIYESINGDTDGAMRLNWAAANVDPVGFTVDLEDIDTDEDLLICIRSAMAAGGTDTPVISADSYFNEADTKVSDDSDALNTSYTERKITIAAADIPSTAVTLSVELTPGAHNAEAMYWTRVHCEATRKLLMDD